MLSLILDMASYCYCLKKSQSIPIFEDLEDESVWFSRDAILMGDAIREQMRSVPPMAESSAVLLTPPVNTADNPFMPSIENKEYYPRIPKENFR